MAIPVARVHLAMAHAALPGLLPSPPKCAMMPLLPSPPCAAIILPNNSSPPRPSRADAAERWYAHKTKQGGGGSPAPSSAGSPGRASSSEKWVSNKKKNGGAGAGAGAGAATSSSSSSSSRADSEERWDANKKPASPTASWSSASRNKGRDGSNKRRATSRASLSSGERWDAQKNSRQAPRGDEIVDDGESSTGSNDMELHKVCQPPQLRRAFYAGPGFIVSPEPSVLPMPSFMVRVAA